MSAKNGSTFRSARRFTGICLAVAFALAALFATAANARPVTKTYLALGDSLAFGYSQQLYNEHQSELDPASFFENGYVDDYYSRLKTHAQYAKVNLGCPGETTKSLIGNKALGAALEGAFGATTEAPCAYQEAGAAFKTPGVGGPLHVPYVGKSQLEAALEQIAIAAGTGKPVQRVTLNIGANDELHQVAACEKEVTEEFTKEGKSKYGASPEEAVKNCLVSHVPTLIKTIITNTEAAGYAIRHGAEFGGVNYSGPITFMASYDPDGEVFHTGEGPGGGFPEGREVLPGSVPLAALINTEEANHFGQGFNPGKNEFGFEACTAEPLTTFNPQNRTEAHKLQKWTNMANFTKFEGKNNGPDIHATPAGYLKLAMIIKKACGN
jgi:hypothetical protein